LECDGKLLGSAIPAKIGAVDCRILFPNAAKDYFSKFRFVGPIPKYPWPHDGAEVKWGGSFGTDGDQVSAWECLAVAIEVSGPENELGNHSFELQKSLCAWLALLQQHHDFRTKLLSSAINVSRTYFDDIHLFSESQTGWEVHFEPRSNSIRVQIPAEGVDSVQFYEQVNEMIDLASQGNQLTIELRLLLDAYRARASGDFRRAVIDAATASEVFLNQKIASGLQSLSSEVVETILVSLNGLNGKSRFARTLGVSLPTENALNLSGLLRTRNRGLHGGRTPTASEVRTALTMAEEILDVSSGVRTEPLKEV